MKLNDISKIIKGKIVTDFPICSNELACDYAFASDLMSDVLCLTCENVALITGLCNVQTVRTADMADFKLIILARGKKADENMRNLANENNIVICETDFSVYKTSGLLFNEGLKPVY